MGVICRALDLRLEREVALKIAIEPIAADDEAMLREGRALAAFNHPNVVTVHEVGVHEGVAYIVMELLRGESLRARIDRSRPGMNEALTWACDVLRGLSAVHQAHMLHLDIKPENVFLTKDGPLKLIDFGIARRKRSGLQEQNEIVGTFAYMAPEQLLGDPLDFRADIFSFGVLLHELATGKHPFAQANVAATMRALMAGDFFQDGVTAPPEIDVIVRACMALDPAQRPASAADVLLDVERAARSLAQQETSPHAITVKQEIARVAPLGTEARISAPNPSGPGLPPPADEAAIVETRLSASTPEQEGKKPPKNSTVLFAGLAAIVLIMGWKFGLQHDSSAPLESSAPRSLAETTAGKPQPTLALESTPSGALVKEAGKELGKTPLVVPLDPAANHARVFVLSLEGYEEITVKQKPTTLNSQISTALTKLSTPGVPSEMQSAVLEPEPPKRTETTRVSPGVKSTKSSASAQPNETPPPVDIRLNR